MDPAGLAFRRVRRLVTSRSGDYLAVQLLGVADAMLWAALLVVGGLLAYLLVSRGITHLVVVPPRPTAVPTWLGNAGPALLTGEAWPQDTGLTPLVVENSRKDTPWLHAELAAPARSLVAGIRPLRSNLGALFSLLLVAVVLLMLLLVLSLVRRRITSRLAVDASSSLRRQIHRQMYRLGQSALPSQGVGPVLTLFTREVNDVRDALAADLDQSARLPLLAILFAIVALVISWSMTLLLGSVAGLAWLASRPLRARSRQAADVASRDAAVQLCLLHEDLGLVRTVRVFGMEGVDNDRFDEHLGLYEEADLRRLRSEASQHPWSWVLLGGSATVALSAIGAVVLARDEYRLSLASVLTILTAVLGVVLVARWMVDLLRQQRVASRSSLAVFEYLDRRPELTMGVGARFLPPLKKSIAFENVSLDDAHGRPLLGDMSATIEAGTRCAVLGLDESVSLALLCLIPRLIDPTKGIVRVDGQDLKDVTLESLRAQVATVLQSDLVFSDSVTANIALGDSSFTLPRVIQAAKIAHAHNFIQNLPDGYDTVIGPLGHYLSVDEQYRIALARAFLHDPSILIIEEPSGQIDEAIKPLIDDTIDRMAKGRTLIFLPRRLSTLRRCDRVIVLNQGHLEAVGTPRQLMKDSKLYRHLQYVNFHKFATGEVEVGQMEG